MFIGNAYLPGFRQLAVFRLPGPLHGLEHRAQLSGTLLWGMTDHRHTNSKFSRGVLFVCFTVLNIGGNPKCNVRVAWPLDHVVFIWKGSKSRLWKRVHKGSGSKNPVCSVPFVVPYVQNNVGSSKERIIKQNENYKAVFDSDLIATHLCCQCQKLATPFGGMLKCLAMPWHCSCGQVSWFCCFRPVGKHQPIMRWSLQCCCGFCLKTVTLA